MEVKRDYYLNQLIARKDNGLIKIITGLRRCGKSYLLFELYRNYLIENGIKEDNLLLLPLEQEENHIMENILYNELVIRGYSVDVGVVEYRYRSEAGKDIRSQLEIDFIAKLGDSQIYVQSALNVDSAEKREQETASLLKINNSFKKIVVVKDAIVPWTDENGICYVGIREFLSGSYQDMVMV
ncbi:MAG: ATP-binding protein [Muribaculaceae bacterium]|nr:ATP-binding protein [Roseburia sp.]MCM1430183.1 ATP-binding protein [Muribaculaceae bacterium]MCM1493113.1 ATP-binding protein [Muribaculaceae bacterium]